MIHSLRRLAAGTAAAVVGAGAALAHDGHSHDGVLGGEAHRVFGIEASLLVALLMIVGAGVVLWRARRNR